MKLIKVLRTDKWVTSGGFNTSAKIGLFECPNCSNHVEKTKSAGIIARSCGLPECRKATFQANPHNAGNKKANRIQDIKFYTTLKERYRLIKQMYTICDSWQTFEGFVNDMHSSYIAERVHGSKIGFVVTGTIASQSTSKWVAAGKYKSYPTISDASKKYLYLIESAGFHKIGITNRIADRVQAISTCNPFSVTLIHAVEVSHAYALEQSLHETYAACNVKGEWFNLTPKQVEEVIDLIDNS